MQYICAGWKRLNSQTSEIRTDRNDLYNVRFVLRKRYLGALLGELLFTA